MTDASVVFFGGENEGPLLVAGVFFKPGAGEVGMLDPTPVLFRVLVDAVDLCRIDSLHPHAHLSSGPKAQVHQQVHGIPVDDPFESRLKRKPIGVHRSHPVGQLQFALGGRPRRRALLRLASEERILYPSPIHN